MNSRYPNIAPLTPASLFPIGEEEYSCFSGGFPNSAPMLNALHLSSDTNLMGSSPPVQMVDMGFDMNLGFTAMRRNSEMAFSYITANPMNRRNSEICLPAGNMESPSTGEFPVISHKPTPRALKAKRCPTNKCPCGGKDDCMEPGCIKSAGHYVCPVCDIEFSRKNSMRRHVLTHINLRPYECQPCQKSFYRSDIYKRHLSSKKCRRNFPHQLSFDHQPSFPDLSSYLNHHIPFQ